MICKVRVEIKLKPSFHDPEGVTVRTCLHDLGIRQIVSVETGKVYYLSVQVSSIEEARSIAELACIKLLANPVKDLYTIEIVECKE